jgi:uncharacterized membrane protein
MLDSASFLGWISGALLFAAVAAWLKLGRRPMLQRLDRRSDSNNQQVEQASRLLLIAVGLSAVAAVLAIAALMFG